MTKLIGKIESDEVDINVTILGAGPQGEPGLSAYEVAVANGFEGDVETWLASLATGGMTQADVEALVTSLLPEVPDVSDFVTKAGILTDTEIQQALKGERGDPGVQGEPGQDGAPGADGKDGADGYTPIKGVDYFDGVDGKDGKDGANGSDGYTPIKGVDYFDGKDGAKGDPGDDGHTPVKGVDYFTEADKAEIVASVLAEIPVVGSEGY